MNTNKSKYIDYTLRKDHRSPLHINNTIILTDKSTKFLEFHMGSKLTRKEHIILKKKLIYHKVKDLYWLIGKKSNLSLENIILITIIKHTRIYGIEQV